jgi:hypothetical protein
VAVGATFWVLRDRADDREERDRRERQEEAARRLREDRADLAAAVAEGDTDAVADLVDGRPSLVDDPVTLPTGEATAVEIGSGGYAVLEADLIEGTEHRITADPEITAVLLDVEGATARDVTDGFAPETSGPHTLLVAPTSGEPDEVRLTLAEVPVESLELFEYVDGTIDEGQPALAYEIEVYADEHYWVYINDDGEIADQDVDVRVTDAEGADVPLDDSAVDLRFVAPGDGPFVVTVSGHEGVTGTFRIRVDRISHTVWTWGAEDDPNYIAPVFELPDDPAEQGDLFANLPGEFQTCVDIRAGVTLTVEASSSTHPLILDIYDNSDFQYEVTAASTLQDRIPAGAAGASLTWSSRGDVDRYVCLRLWAEGNPPSWRAGWTLSATT